jgi:predicted phage-related endonuclease
MVTWAFDGRRVVLPAKPKRTKKITATRLPAVCGLDKWKSPFGAWCEITRLAEPPFEDNVYTIAGKVIEPRVVDWWREKQTFTTVKAASEVFDAKMMGYDFFQNPMFGGMWDALMYDKQKPVAVVEVKTSSRPQDWTNGVPQEKALQALLYAHLLNVDRVYLLAVLLAQKDLEEPTGFVPTDDNVLVFELDRNTTLVAGKTVDEWVKYAEAWWKKHIDTGKSPEFDEAKDKVYLDILRSSAVTDTDTKSLAEQATAVAQEIERIREESGLNALEKELSMLKDALKDLLKGELEADARLEKVVVDGWELKKSTRVDVNKKALEADGLLDKYSVVTERYVLTQAKEK